MGVYAETLQGLVVDVGYEELADVSGNSLDLTLVGATLSESGGPGPSLPAYIDFDGVDDHAWAPDNAAISYFTSDPGSHGLFVWVPVSSSSDDFAVLFGKGAGSGYEFRHLDDVGKDEFRWSPRASLGPVDAAAVKGEWVFYGMTRYQVGGEESLRLVRRRSVDTTVQFVDGETLVQDNRRYPETTHTGNLFLGSRGGAERYFHGRVAGYFSVGRVLTDDEFDEVYDAAFVETAGDAPTGLAAEQKWSVVLSWDATTGPYTVRRNSTVLASGIAGTTFVDTSVAGGTSYDYTVEGENGIVSAVLAVAVDDTSGGVFFLRRDGAGWASAP